MLLLGGFLPLFLSFGSVHVFHALHLFISCLSGKCCILSFSLGSSGHSFFGFSLGFSLFGGLFRLAFDAGLLQRLLFFHTAPLELFFGLVLTCLVGTKFLGEKFGILIVDFAIEIRFNSDSVLLKDGNNTLKTYIIIFCNFA